MTLQPASSARITRLQKWLWRGALLVSIFVITFGVANLLNFVKQGQRLTTRSVGHDFIAFYTGGTFLREGHFQDVYELDKLKAFQRDLIKRKELEIGDSFGPFWNPPVFAWVFAPLSKLDYFSAWWIWFWINVGCLIGAVILMVQMIRGGETPMLRRKDWTVWGLVALLVPFSQPAIQSLGHGQNTCVSLLLLTSIVWFWRRDHRLLAGMACGLLFYKPQLALVVSGIVCITLGWRAMLGVAISGALLLGITEATMPGMNRLWMEKLPALARYMQVERRYMWDRHVTLRAFWRLLIQGYEVGPMKAAVLPWVASIAVLALGLTLAVVRTMLSKSSRDWLIAATVVSMPLLMPFYFDYDLLLLSVAAVLFAVRWRESQMNSGLDRWIFGVWVVLFAWTFVNPFVARWTHVNGTVLLLSALAGMLVARACAVECAVNLAGRRNDEAELLAVAGDCAGGGGGHLHHPA